MEHIFWRGVGMIVSVNSKPELLEFKKLMKRTDQLLNEDAKKRNEHFY